MAGDHNYLNELNDIQRKAVTHTTGPVMVIAGPGSGKTRVLTYRIAYLIQNGVIPYKILALTFTNKAAKEMKIRISNVVGEIANKVWAGTFHSIFARILRTEAEKIGYPKAFTIYDRDDSRSLLNEVIRELKLDKTKYATGPVLARISSAKSNLITPAKYAQDAELTEYDESQKRPLVHLVYKRYSERCFKAGAMDFDDLLLQMFRLLYTNPENVREKYQNLFDHILVDEFQDTNYLQYAIVKLLSGDPSKPNNICIVGDDAQSIYSFRGATIENILQFENDFPNVVTFKLEQNYRSVQSIVKAANDVIGFNKKQIKKEIWTDKEGSEKIKMIKGMSDSEEGRLVSNAIIEYKNRFQLANNDIAILYRTNAQSRIFEEHLRRNNMSYKVFGGLSFYQRKEVKDLLGYMRLSVNTKDDEAFRRVINFPKRGIGKTTIDKISDFAAANNISNWEAVQMGQVPQRAAARISEFMTSVEAMRKKAQQNNAWDAAIFIAKKSGVYDLLKNDTTIEGKARMENVNALLDGVKAFLDNDEVGPDGEAVDKTLAGYMQNIALLTDLDGEEEQKDFISLMSVHTAKGLEFPCVFVVGLEENLFPSFLAQGSLEQLDEERRLFYVAITRAERFLMLSYAASRYQYGKIRYNDPSRFLKEISDDHVDSNLAMKERPKFSAPKVLAGLGGLRRTTAQYTPKIDEDTFVVSPSADIKQGMEVLHMRFGKGVVLNIDGTRDKRVATIEFAELGDQSERRIMLNYAKMQILTPGNE